MEIQYGDLRQLHWLWLIPICGAATAYAVLAGRRARRRFATQNLLPRLVPPLSIVRLWGSTLLGCGAIAALALALVDLRWGQEYQEVPQQGIELMFVLDVSRSMLAEDTSPNRLTRARQQISDTIDELAGDRVGLVIFAGEAIQKIPLTSHYDDFKQTLASVDAESVRRGGSRLGDAIRVAADGFLTKTNDHKAMVILTDGEDQESDPLGAAEAAHANQGVRIFTVGLGDMDQGARIPVIRNRRQTYLQHEGQQVWSKLNGQILRQVAERTDGAYIPAGTKRVDMADVYHGYIAAVPAQQFETARIHRYQARFQWCLLPALLLTVLEVWWSTRRPQVDQGLQGAVSARGAKQHPTVVNPVVATGNPVVRSVTVLMFAGTLLAGQGVAAAAAGDRVPYNRAVELYRAGEIEQAAALFESVAASLDTSLAAKARFNAGNCHYSAAIKLHEEQPADAIEQLQQAIGDYRSALKLDPHDQDARINIELASRWQAELRQALEQPPPSQPPPRESSTEPPQGPPSEPPPADEPQNDESQNDEPQTGEPQTGEPQTDESQTGESRTGESQTGESQTDEPQTGESRTGESQTGKSPTGEPRAPEPPAPRPQSSDGSDEPAPDPHVKNSMSPEGDLQLADPRLRTDPGTDGRADPQPTVMDGQMTAEEARKMLQAIRDREMLRRLRRQRSEAARRIPVEKDW